MHRYLHLMDTKFDYTTNIRRMSFQYPLFSALIIQTIFWCMSYTVLGIVLYFSSKGVASSFGSAAESSFIPILFSSLVMGVFYGIVLGMADFYLLRKWSKGKSLGKLIFLKVLVYFIILLIIFAFIRFVLWQAVLMPIYFRDAKVLNEKVWGYYFDLVAVYTLFMNVFISFFIQINKKFGPGVLLPFVLGKYVHPQIEERAFIFLDLKSSTTHAEKLGHKQYSQFIRDCFLDINNVSTNYSAEIYQYVGDQIVLTWLVNAGMNMAECFNFYFDCQNMFISRKNYYKNTYGLLPEFKASLHSGIVTCVEVGDVKREIAYHGDTLNVAARILAKCHENKADIIFTASVLQRIHSMRYTYQEIGNVLLKGKKKQVLLYKINAS